MYDIALYGHLTNDRIFEDFKETNTVGAIGNVWHHLTIVNRDLKVYVCPTEIGEALISTGHTGLALSYSQLDKNYDITKDSSIYYQRTWRKGQPKISKQWMDVIPILYTINRWFAYDSQKDFFVK